MKRDNKMFIKSMIITAVIGLTVLMVSLFIGIKYFINQNDTHLGTKPESIIKEETPKVEYSSTILALVQTLSEDKIVAFDIEKKQEFNREVSVTTKITDAYDKTIPLSSIKKGDIVEVIYQPEKESIVSISKTARVWEKKNISGIKINTASNELVIGKNTYRFTSDVFVLTEDGVETSPHFISEHDIVNLQGVGDNVWSISIVESAANLEIQHPPTQEGMLEIDRTMMIPLKDIVAPISIEPGKHKVVVNMKGYEVVNKEIEVKSGEKAVLDLAGTKMAMTELKVSVNNKELDYHIKIGDKSFNKGDAISIQQGKYEVAITASGYLPWKKEIEFNKEEEHLRVTLQEEKQEEDKNLQQTDSSNNSKLEHAITISTDPIGASVYIGDTYKGNTPLNVVLPLGDYQVSLKRENYKDYTAHILLDSNNTQNSFLYVLTPDH